MILTIIELREHIVVPFFEAVSVNAVSSQHNMGFIRQVYLRIQIKLITLQQFLDVVDLKRRFSMLHDPEQLSILEYNKLRKLF